MNPTKDEEGSESYYEEEILEEYEEFLEEEEDGPGIIRRAAGGNEMSLSTPPVASSPALPMHPMVAALKGGNSDGKPASSRPSHPMVAALKASNDDTNPVSSRPSHPMVAILNGSGSSDQNPPVRPVHPMVSALQGGGGGQDIAPKAPSLAQPKQKQALASVPASSGVPSRPPHPLFGGGGGGGLNDLQSAIRKAATDRNVRVEKEGIKEPAKEGKSKLVPVEGRVSGSPQTSSTGARIGGGSGDTAASLADQVAMLAAKRNQRRAADISKSSGATGDEASTVISELSVPKTFVSTKAVVPYDTRKEEQQQQQQKQSAPRPLSSTPEVLPFKSPPLVPKQPVTIPSQQSSEKSISASTPKSVVVPLSTCTSQSIGMEPEPLKESSSTKNNESSSKSVPVSATHDDKELVSKVPTPTDTNNESGGKSGWFGKNSQTKAASTTATATKIGPPKQTIPAVENKSTEFQKVSLKPVLTSSPPTTNALDKPEQAISSSAPFGQGMLKPVGTSATTTTVNEKKKNNDPSNVTTTKAITNVVEDENGATKTTTTTTTTTTTKVKKITKNDPEYETTEYKFGCLCTIM